MSSRTVWISLSTLSAGLVIVLVSGAIGLLRQEPTDASPRRERSAASTGARGEGTPFEGGSAARPSKPVGSGNPSTPGTAAARTLPKAGAAGGEPGPAAGREKRTATFRTRVLDENLEPALRVRDLISLHQVKGVTPEVADSMLNLLRRSQDDVIRERIVTGLEGVTTEPFKAEALRLLGSDASARVRKASAGALLAMKSDPTVKAALEAAGKNDPDQDVRREAGRTVTWTERRPAKEPEKAPEQKK